MGIDPTQDGLLARTDLFKSAGDNKGQNLPLMDSDANSAGMMPHKFTAYDVLLNASFQTHSGRSVAQTQYRGTPTPDVH